VLEAGAAFVAWLGMSLVVLADGRRGLALGAAIATAGLALLVGQGAGLIDAGALALGGAAMVARRLTRGPGGWQLMPPGSTPRLVLCVAAGLLSLWIAFSVTTGAGAALRFGVMTVVGLSGARALFSNEPAALLTAVGLLALAVAAIAGAGESSPDPWPYVAGAVVAAGAGWVSMRTAHAA
jgi:hypothetical protein